jgi:hypothetical protein
MNKTSITSQLNRLDTDRLRAYRELLDFYHGRQWEGRERRGEKRLTFNYTKVFIDKITSYLMSGISFVVEAEDDSAEAKTKAQRAEVALNQVYEENNLEQLDLETEIDCAIMGDACYKVTWDGEAKRVRITAPDVQGLYAWWLGDDITRIWRIASKYQLSAEEAGFLYGLKPKGKQATIVELWTDAEFELYLDDTLIEKKPNPYGGIPFIIYPNLREPKRFWGISDLTQIMESQRELNRLQVEGYDPSEEEAIVVDAFAWEEIDRLYDRLGRIEDRNIESVAGAEDRGESYLRKVEMAAVNGAILTPVNRGQQLYDVIDITDSRAGLSAAKRRVNGLTLVYSPQRGEYRQRLLLGGV